MENCKMGNVSRAANRKAKQTKKIGVMKYIHYTKIVKNIKYP